MKLMLFSRALILFYAIAGNIHIHSMETVSQKCEATSQYTVCSLKEQAAFYIAKHIQNKDSKKKISKQENPLQPLNNDCKQEVYAYIPQMTFKLINIETFLETKKKIERLPQVYQNWFNTHYQHWLSPKQKRIMKAHWTFPRKSSGFPKLYTTFLYCTVLTKERCLNTHSSLNSVYHLMQASEEKNFLKFAGNEEKFTSNLSESCNGVIRDIWNYKTNQKAKEICEKHSCLFYTDKKKIYQKIKDNERFCPNIQKTLIYNIQRAGVGYLAAIALEYLRKLNKPKKKATWTQYFENVTKPIPDNLKKKEHVVVLTALNSKAYFRRIRDADHLKLLLGAINIIFTQKKLAHTIETIAELLDQSINTIGYHYPNQRYLQYIKEPVSIRSELKNKLLKEINQTTLTLEQLYKRRRLIPFLPFRDRSEINQLITAKILQTKSGQAHKKYYDFIEEIYQKSIDESIIEYRWNHKASKEFDEHVRGAAPKGIKPGHIDCEFRYVFLMHREHPPKHNREISRKKPICTIN